MKKRMKLIFVSQNGIIHTLISGAVLLGTQSLEDFNGHVAAWFEEVIDEAADRVMKEVLFEAHEPRAEFVLNGNKYDDSTNKFTFEFEVDEELYNKAVNMALRLEGRPYGLTTDCVATLIKERTDCDITKYLNCENTVICSEVVARIIHAMFNNYLEGENLNLISPKKGYHSFKDFIPTEPRITLISAVQG